jgi:hypothetical protein
MTLEVEVDVLGLGNSSVYDPLEVSASQTSGRAALWLMNSLGLALGGWLWCGRKRPLTVALGDLVCPLPLSFGHPSVHPPID